MNVILVTGASSGMGREFVRQLDPYFSNIDEIWLIARNRIKLKEIAGSINHKCRILAMDITREGQMDRLEDTLAEKGAVVRLLINCAGYGIMGDFKNADAGEQLGMIRVNCEALTHMTLKCIPFMREGSRIIQMASSAAFLPQPGFAVYAATKSYVLSFSRAIGEELKDQGIYVTCVCPGPVDTPFFEIAEKYGTTLSVKKFTMVSAREVARDALRDSFLKRQISVCSLPIKAFGMLAKYIPHQVLLEITKMLRKR